MLPCSCFAPCCPLPPFCNKTPTDCPPRPCITSFRDCRCACPCQNNPAPSTPCDHKGPCCDNNDDAGRSETAPSGRQSSSWRADQRGRSSRPSVNSRQSLNSRPSYTRSTRSFQSGLSGRRSAGIHRRLCYSNTTVYYGIHERSECVPVDSGFTNLIHLSSPPRTLYTSILVCSLSSLLLNEHDDDDDRRSCVDFTLEVEANVARCVHSSVNKPARNVTVGYETFTHCRLYCGDGEKK